MNTYNLSPSNLGYFVFNASNLENWKEFAIDIIGMQLADKQMDSTLSFRLDNHAQRFIFQQSEDDDIAAVGWEFDTEQDLDNAATNIKNQNYPIELAEKAFCDNRCVEKLYTCIDPTGVQHELYFGPAIAPLNQPFNSPILLGDFIAGKLGAGHYVSVTQDLEATDHFFRNILCLRLSDYIRAELGPGGPILDTTFLHTKTGRHHSAAFAVVPFPKKLHHVMVQVENMNDVGLAFDRCKKANLPIVMELGHHPNDQMFSFYVQTPGGFVLEFGWGGIIIDDSTWSVKSYSQLSDWGHQQPS